MTLYFSKFLYNLFLYLYYTFIRLISPFHHKASLWLKGRNNINLTDKPNSPTIWIHCASLGEFEQGRPVIAQLRANYPDHFLLLTFFSPSGFEQMKNFEGVNHVSYLPFDYKSHLLPFIAHYNPKLVVIVKYEFWFNWLDLLIINNINYMFISLYLKKTSGLYFKSLIPYLLQAKVVFCQDSYQSQYLKKLGINAIENNDTRFDRVIQLPDIPFENVSIEKFIANAKILIAGSTWPNDDKLLIQGMKVLQSNNWKLILIPHDINNNYINKLINTYPEISTIDNIKTNTNILIVNTVGMLSKIYRYSKLTYIGGGFDNGIHNTLEPAAYGNTLLFGPKYNRFKEAVQMIHLNTAFCVKNVDNLIQQIIDLSSNDVITSNAIIQKNYICQNTGGSLKISNYINKIV